MIHRYILSFFILCFCSASSFSQTWHYHSYSNNSKGDKKVGERAYFGIEYPQMNLNMMQSYVIDRSSLGGSLPSVDTTIFINKKVNSKLGFKGAFGLVGGTSFKLAKFSETSILALDISGSVELYNWSIGTVKYSAVDSSIDEVFCVVERLPIALMYKTGAEASLSSKNKIMFGIGAGFAPSLAEAVYDQTNGGYLKLSPFITAELGAWAGLGIKFKATYYPGSPTFLSFSGDDLPAYTTNGNLSVLASGSNNFVFSLVVLLNSHQWDDGNYY